jgi:hypothetical protein
MPGDGLRSTRSSGAGDYAASRTGLRRVDWVRLTEDEGRCRAEAVGVGFRLPAIRAIPLTLAADLIASGVPHVRRAAEFSQAGA